MKSNILSALRLIKVQVRAGRFVMRLCSGPRGPIVGIAAFSFSVPPALLNMYSNDHDSPSHDFAIMSENGFEYATDNDTGLQYTRMLGSGACGSVHEVTY